ncbi:ribonuclease H-like domain-containing protein [Thiosocius teredinicola]|uniref:ribonuclease H-like domain-containing protein n=1 Tax=Thiosocius teredinicola TaxID=1973002 RepID=UPI000991026A
MSLAGKLDRLRGQAPPRAAMSVADRLQHTVRSRGTAQQCKSSANLATALSADIEIDGVVVHSATRSMCCDPHDLPLTALPEVAHLRDPNWVYIDTETTGLSGGVGNLAFMVGMARYNEDGTLALRQFTLANMAGESRLLCELSDWLGEDPVLVSYNGKCFDIPLLAARLRLHRVDDVLSGAAHLDLMYTVRRAYRLHWPDCRLQTAERELLDLHRLNDLPGAEAPVAWRAWLQRGATRQLAQTLAHNFQDVLSLAQLHRRLLADYNGSKRTGVDYASIGRTWDDAGYPQLALQVWEGAADQLDERGQLWKARRYRRQGDWRRAVAVWSTLSADGNAEAALELSKYYEHRRRDLHAAMHYAVQCETHERQTRCARLRAKLEPARRQLPLIAV